MFGAFRYGQPSARRIAQSLSRRDVLRTSRSLLGSVAPVRKSTDPTVISSRHFSLFPRKFQQTAHAFRDVEETAEPAASGGYPGPMTTFQQLADQASVSEHVVKALTDDMRISTMTQVQSMTLSETLKGADMFAQAKTGTGKTIGFLIPLLNNILRALPDLDRPVTRSRASARDIRGLIISPTRELAEQIATEARRVTKRTGIVVQTAVGGTGKREAMYKMRKEGCHLLVGTPGRLQDILSDPYSGVEAPDLNTFVMDEADRLLDQGFAPAIREISQLLPNKREVDRQTLMFSATIQKEVLHLVREVMKPGYKFVRTVQEGEQATHARVPQKMVNVGGFENMLPALLELCKREINASAGGEPFKAIVYFSSTANVTVAASTFLNLREVGGSVFDRSPLHPLRIVEMHARLTQGQRTQASESFRRSKSAIMFSSDVTARGMDFPGVTHIIQMGTPPSREDYVHRLGRTARADRTGQGWLLVTDLELREARARLGSFPLQPDHSLQTAKIDMSQPADLPREVADTLTQVTEASKMIDRLDKVQAWQALLSIYSYLNKERLFEALSNLSRYGWGWDKPPSVSMKLARMLNLDRIPGIEIREDRAPREGGYSSEGRGGFSRGMGASGGSRGPPGRSSFGSEGRTGGGRPFGDGGSRGPPGRSSFGSEARTGGGRPFGDGGARSSVRSNDRNDRKRTYDRNDRGSRSRSAAY
ncbi:MAG: hypothetical protein M1837_002164 [Sclerophora amabilis]|nr:MAG: hypothetical protein M1837_002164 [Sclerophora amabilis]